MTFSAYSQNWIVRFVRYQRLEIRLSATSQKNYLHNPRQRHLIYLSSGEHASRRCEDTIYHKLIISWKQVSFVPKHDKFCTLQRTGDGHALINIDKGVETKASKADSLLRFRRWHLRLGVSLGQGHTSLVVIAPLDLKLLITVCDLKRF